MVNLPFAYDPVDCLRGAATRPQTGSSLITKAGWLTRKGFEHGFIEKRGTDETYCTLTKRTGHKPCYEVRIGGRWWRGGAACSSYSLDAARKAFLLCDHELFNLAAKSVLRVDGVNPW